MKMTKPGGFCTRKTSEPRRIGYRKSCGESTDVATDTFRDEDVLVISELSLKLYCNYSCLLEPPVGVAFLRMIKWTR